MPIVSPANLVRLRTTRHATQLALSVYHPATIWTARIDGTQTTGDTTITVKTVVQVKAPAKNFLVMIGSAAGAMDLGTARFKSYSAPTLTVGTHNSTLTDNAYVTILEVINPEAIHPTKSATDVVFEDGNVAYTNENVQFMPLARMGAPAVAYIDPSTGLATVNFYSRSTGIGGATISTSAWVFPSGTPGTSATAGTVGAPVSVTWNTAGQYYVSLTVTDNNGKTHTGYRPVFIYNSVTTPYTRIETSGLQGDADSGVWSVHLKVYGDADATEFPSNALIVLSAKDWYGDEEISIGNETWRENIVYVGYIRRGTVTVDRLHGFVEFDTDSISGVADNLWHLGGALASGTPGGWHVITGMTYNLACHHILTQHSTVTQLSDTYLNLPTYTVGNLDLTDASLTANLSQIAGAVRGRVGCNAQGSLYLEINPQLQSLASRSVSYVITTTNPDIRDEIDLGDELQEKQCPQVDFSGENATATPIFSLAPANPWTYGLRPEKKDGIRVTDQTEANEIAGLYEAYLNNAFGDVVINWRGNYRCFDIFPAEPIAVVLAASQNTRGITWTNQRCWIKSVSYDYRPGILLCSTTVEKDSYGALGVTGDYPTTEPPVVVPPPPEEPPIINPPQPPIDIPGKGNLLYVSSLKGVAKCVGAYGTDGTDGTPVWTAVITGLAGAALQVRGFNLDPWSRSGDHFTAAYAMTDDGFYRCTGLPNAGVWARVLSLSDAATLTGIAVGNLTMPWSFTPSVLLSGFVMCSVYDSTTGRLYVLWSLDSGATWNADTSKWLYSNEWTVANRYDAVALHASPHVASTYYATTARSGGIRRNQTYPGADVSPTCGVWKCTTMPDFQPAASYGLVAMGNNFIYDYFMQYRDSAGNPYPDDEQSIISGHAGAGGYTATGTGTVRKFTTLFTPPWSPGYGDMEGGTAIGHADMVGTELIVANMLNDNSLFAWITNTLYATLDGGSNWTKYTSVAISGRGITITNLFDIPIDATICFATGYAAGGSAGIAHVGMTINRGATWVQIDNNGLANDLDTVLGLGAGDMDISYIVVDYFKQ